MEEKTYTFEDLFRFGLYIGTEINEARDKAETLQEKLVWDQAMLIITNGLAELDGIGRPFANLADVKGVMAYVSEALEEYANGK